MKNPKQQAGVVLAISLIILLVLTLVVVSSTQNGVVQERMAAAVRDGHVSLQAAEAGLALAEVQLYGAGGAGSGTGGFIAIGNNFNGSGGLFAENTGPTNILSSATWSSSAITTATVGGETVQYFIELLGDIPDPVQFGNNINLGGYGDTTAGSGTMGFRVVSRSMGASGKAERIVIAYYGKNIQ